MFTILAYCNRDIDIMLPLIQWINELGGCKKHDLLLIRDHRTPPTTGDAILQEARKGWNSVRDHVAKASIDGWPEGANYMFRIGSEFASYTPKLKYWFWMEPDAIPIKEGWLDLLEEEYLRCGSPFMGDMVEVNDIPLHMSGVAVYPNPLYNFAGEACRAFDMAWDMFAKDQITPRAYYTKLIEHAWQHPEFKNQHEVDTQIAKETVLFHASKDGSLIKLLRQKHLSGKGAILNEKPMVLTASTSEGTRVHTGEKLGSGIGSPSAQSISCDIFIRTYPQDYKWLEACLASVKKYAHGFRKVVVVSPEEFHYGERKIHVEGVEWKVLNDETEDGYLAQQITKLYADVITDYQADYFLHIDSDVILTRKVTPQDFLSGDKVIWLFTPYDHVDTPWKTITEKFMKEQVTNEFMRRLPIMVPKWIYPKLREFCHQTHGRIISEYIRTQQPRAFSEFNAIGAYAYSQHYQKFLWVNTMSDPLPEPFAKQFRSWNGITPEIKKEIETILAGSGEREHEGSGTRRPDDSSLVRDDPLPVHPRIKKLANGLWVLEGDQITGWIEQEGRLDHDQNLLPKILKHIKPGDVVIDVGAYIGDHTIAYSGAVGEMGRVVAFEPNPVVYECLRHNMEKHRNVRCIDCGLSDKAQIVPLSGSGHWESAYIGDDHKIAEVQLEALDSWNFDPNLIKIDVEGNEPRVLWGAERTINLYHPKMVIEMNVEALQRQKFLYGDILDWLKNHGYRAHVMQENCTFDSPLYDIYCEHVVSSKPPGGVPNAIAQPIPPEAAPLTPYGEMLKAIATLKEIATTERMRVMQNLRYAGLTPRWPKRRKKG